MDAVLIVFSVLLALTIDKAVEAWQIRKQKNAARSAIMTELGRNEKLVQALLTNHREILARIEQIESDENDSTRIKLLSKKHFDVWVLTDGKSLAPEFASHTAWETARVTGIIAEFDYEEIEALTRIYNQQDIIFRGTLSGIVDLLFQRETNDLKNLDETLQQFKTRIGEIILQERALLGMYEAARTN
jgi:hypothetical protein